jgi:hypothetical protein
MIRQYLSNTNKSATIPIFKKFLELNRPYTVILDDDDDDDDIS